MLRNNRCMYMAHVCFYVCCCDFWGVCGNICCVAAVGVLNMLYVYVRGVMDVVFSVCIVRRGAVGARV